jgi:hypothetical protein
MKGLKYYRWQGIAPRLPNGDCCWTIDFPLDYFRPLPDSGRRVTKWNPKLIGVYPEAPATVDFCDGGTRIYPIFSLRLRRFFESQYPKVIQFLPFRLERDDGKFPMTGYALGNYLKVIECVDRRRTKVAENDWTPMDSGAYRIRGPVILNGSAIRGAVCFRVRGYPGCIVVDSSLHERLEQGGFVGCRFEELQVSLE